MLAATSVGQYMEDVSPATFRPTRQQAVARGLYLGALVAVAGVIAALVAAVVLDSPPIPAWVLLSFGPPLAGALAGVVTGRRTSVQINARGIVCPDGGVAPWADVVDLRAERRGARTVVSVYLESGQSVRLQAPYSGEFFAADPRFETKMFALSHLWRSHRFGGLPG